MKQLLLIALTSCCLLAQPPLAFEVASVKVRPAGSLITMVGGSPSGARLTLEAMSLSNLVSYAWNVKPWQVAGGPQWAGVKRDQTTLDDKTARFDITAKAEGDAPRSPEEFRQMLQSLLADRFHVAIGHETRQMPVYALTIDKGGSKLHESAPDAKGIMRMNGGGKITGSGATIDQLVGWFSNANGVDRPTIDRTGLTGHYDFTLEWSILKVGDDTDLSVPDIFTAMPQQLGLRLSPQNAPVEVLTIEHAEMPTEN